MRRSSERFERQPSLSPGSHLSQFRASAGLAERKVIGSIVGVLARWMPNNVLNCHTSKIVCLFVDGGGDGRSKGEESRDTNRCVPCLPAVVRLVREFGM